MLSENTIHRIIHKAQKPVYGFRSQSRTYFGQEVEIVTRKESKGFLSVIFVGLDDSYINVFTVKIHLVL